MKKRIVGISIAVMLAEILAIAGGDGRKPLMTSVTPSSTLIIAAANQAPTNAWAASATATLGEVVHVSSNYFYWVTVAGTFETNAPSHYDGDATNGTATLRFIHRERHKLTLSNNGTNNVSLAFGNAAEAGKGFILLANNANKLETDYQGAIYGIGPAGTTNNVPYLEE